MGLSFAGMCLLQDLGANEDLHRSSSGVAGLKMAGIFCKKLSHLEYMFEAFEMILI